MITKFLIFLAVLIPTWGIGLIIAGILCGNIPRWVMRKLRKK